jgi:hypothetical protein
MAKKKEDPRPKFQPIENWRPSKPISLQVRSSLEWKAWVEKLAKYDRTTAAELADRALAAYARSIGFPDPPPDR